MITIRERRVRPTRLSVFGLLCIVAAGCQNADAQDTKAPTANLSVPTDEPPPKPAPAEPVDTNAYPWWNDLDLETDDVERLEARFEPPADYERVAVSKGSYAAWLRGLPVIKGDTTVRSHRGATIAAPSAAVIALDIGSRNLQQCADSAIRLRAEFLWSSGGQTKVAYHFTSGDRSAWKDWVAGERFVIAGNKVGRVRGPARRNSHSEFRRYLDHVFRYAGTRSLSRDSKAVKPGEPAAAGDFFVSPGSPGHAVVLLDIAEDGDGNQVALIGQGFMPAQSFHVVTASHDGVVDKVWFRIPDKPNTVVDTPSWEAFPRNTLRRFSR